MFSVGLFSSSVEGVRPMMVFLVGVGGRDNWCMLQGLFFLLKL